MRMPMNQVIDVILYGINNLCQNIIKIDIITIFIFVYVPQNITLVMYLSLMLHLNFVILFRRKKLIRNILYRFVYQTQW